MCNKLVVLQILIMAMLAGPSLADLNNSSFETGDLTGWTAAPDGGSVGVTTGWGGYSPTDGEYFALLGAGSQDNPVTLSQGLTASAGDVLTFDYFWQGGDYLPYNDWGDGRILSGTGETVATLFSDSIDEWGNYGGTGWVPVSYTFTSPGTYQLLFEVANSGDGGLPSHIGIDDLSFTGGIVPVPAAMLLGMLGLSTAGMKLRRFV